MKRGLISVIMSAYNSEKFIADSIKSISNQTYDNWELILINDCSTDHTSQIVSQFMDSDSRIKIINNSENYGLTKSLNIGIANSNGEYIARLDSDDLAESSRFEKQVNYLSNYPEVGLVGSGAYLIDSSSNKVGSMNVISRQSSINKFLIHLNPFIHSSLMFRKKALDDAGYYREKFRYSQDYDLVLRLCEKYRSSNIAEPLIRWRVSDGSLTMKHHTLQRIYADIAIAFAIERRTFGHDNYEFSDFNTIINKMMAENKGRYLCENGVYDLLFYRRYQNGFIELLKGVLKGGFPYNSIMRGFIQIASKI